MNIGLDAIGMESSASISTCGTNNSAFFRMGSSEMNYSISDITGEAPGIVASLTRSNDEINNEVKNELGIVRSGRGGGILTTPESNAQLSLSYKDQILNY